MDLKLHELAELFEVDSDAVIRWIEHEQLPAHVQGERYHLNAVEVEEWALAKGLRVPPGLLRRDAPNGLAATGLAAAVSRGGLHRNIPGATRSAVLRAMASLPTIPTDTDRDLLYQLLETRESLASTGVGRGIAIPHPRSPIVLHIDEPVVLVCVLAQPVDFAAIDGKPVWLSLLVLSPTVQSHLQLLSEISHAVRDPEVMSMLEGNASTEQLVARLAKVETHSRPPPARPK